MNFIARLLRIILAADTALGMIFMPLLIPLVIGCLVVGNFVAALTFTVMGVLGAIIYGRYWRRFPLGKFPQN